MRACKSEVSSETAQRMQNIRHTVGTWPAYTPREGAPEGPGLRDEDDNGKPRKSRTGLHVRERVGRGLQWS
jgi:hypothetical protein